jgi:hypothetical protein
MFGYWLLVYGSVRAEVRQEEVAWVKGALLLRLPAGQGAPRFQIWVLPLCD